MVHKTSLGTSEFALVKARQLAAEGPRVSAILTDGKHVEAVAGFIDADQVELRQVALVTPDGRIWLQSDEAGLAACLKGNKS